MISATTTREETNFIVSHQKPQRDTDSRAGVRILWKKLLNPSRSQVFNCCTRSGTRRAGCPCAIPGKASPDHALLSSVRWLRTWDKQGCMSCLAFQASPAPPRCGDHSQSETVFKSRIEKRVARIGNEPTPGRDRSRWRWKQPIFVIHNDSRCSLRDSRFLPVSCLGLLSPVI